jgi:protein-disulfide isomerase
LQWLGAVGLAALAYPVFSIHYQWRVAKQWCALCLAVQAILLLQGAFLWMSNYLPVLSLDTFNTFLIPHSLFLISAVYLLPLLAWLSLKPMLKRWQTAKQEQRAYRRLKFNPDVFAGLLQKQKAVQTSAEGLGITLGPANAPHQLIKVCNPYCGPCSKAHPKIEKLLHQHSNLQVKILFMVPDEPGQRPHTAASHLMAIAQNANSQQQVQQALDDWYLPEQKNYDAFAAKYPLNGAVAAEAPAITAMQQWSKANDIRYTPTIFYNGHELPPEYDLEDLSYFLQE